MAERKSNDHELGKAIVGLIEQDLSHAEIGRRLGVSRSSDRADRRSAWDLRTRDLHRDPQTRTASYSTAVADPGVHPGFHRP